MNPVRVGMVGDPKDYSWCGYARAVVGEKDCVRGITALWGQSRGAMAAMAEHRVFLFEEGSGEMTEDRRHENARRLRGKIQDPRTGEWKTRVGIDARKVWEERQRGGRLPLHILLRLRSRYLVDGAVIGRAEFVRRVTGGSIVAGTAAGTTTGKPGKKMRFGARGGLPALRDLRVDVAG